MPTELQFLESSLLSHAPVPSCTLFQEKGLSQFAPPLIPASTAHQDPAQVSAPLRTLTVGKWRWIVEDKVERNLLASLMEEEINCQPAEACERL